MRNNLIINIKTLAIIFLSLSAFSWASVLGNLPRVLFLLSAIILMYIPRSKSKLSSNYIFFFSIFIIFAFNSMLHAPDPIRALIKTAEIVLLVIFLARINGNKNISHHHCLHVFMYSSFFVTVISVLPYSFFVKGSFIELSSAIPVINSNTVGSISGLMFIYSLNYKNKILQIFSIAILIMSSSASAMAAIFIALGTAFLLSHSTNYNKRLRLILKLTTLLSIISLIVYYVWFNLLSDEIKSLSGRLTMWEYGTEYLLAKVGYFHGIGLGNIAVQFESDISRRVSLHNSYLEIFYALGGSFIFLTGVFIVNALWKCSRASYLLRNSFYLKATIFLLIKGATSSALSYYTFDFIALCFVMMALNEYNFEFKQFRINQSVEI